MDYTRSHRLNDRGMATATAASSQWSLPRFSFVDEIGSKNKILTGHVNGSTKFGSFSRCTARWIMMLSLLWVCTFIVNVDSYNPLPSRHGCCDDGNILIDASSLILYCGCLCNVF